MHHLEGGMRDPQGRSEEMPLYLHDEHGTNESVGASVEVPAERVRVEKRRLVERAVALAPAQALSLLDGNAATRVGDALLLRLPVLP